MDVHISQILQYCIAWRVSLNLVNIYTYVLHLPGSALGKDYNSVQNEVYLLFAVHSLAPAFVEGGVAGGQS